MIGQTISHYRILEKLGGGGMGVVYKGQDLKLDRFVALKFLPPELTANAEAKERFIHEARATSKLQHNNICTVHDIDESPDGQMFMVMDYYEGKTLREEITHRQLPIENCIDIVLQIGQGLAEAHQHGILHRDIKPANILITKNGVAKIVDFGLAKLAGQAKLTKTGTTVGTAAYMSPEQTMGEEVGQQTDIWSLAVVLFEMLAGHLPFRGDHEAAMMYSIVHEEPQALLRFRPDVQPSIAAVVSKALQKDRASRYQTAREFLTELTTATTRGVQLPRPEKSIVVLPFVDMSPQRDQEYFCDGIAEELISALGKLQHLHVASRTSTFSFKGKGLDVRTIGEKLNVTTVLEGSIRKAGNRLRITAQLVNVEDGYQMWSERYDRELDDVFTVQDEISKAIVDTLKIKLGLSKDELIVKRYTENLEAYQLYLKGRFYLNERTPASLKKSLEHFDHAAQKDSNYALAYAGMADAYLLLGWYGDRVPSESFSRARAAVKKALDIDQSLAEAHASLAAIKEGYDWDFVGAEQEFQRAIELNPSYAMACHWYGVYLARKGKFDEAHRQLQRALELDPYSPTININVGMAYYLAREYEKAIPHIRKALEIDPNFIPAHSSLGQVMLASGHHDDAIIELMSANITGNDPWILSNLIHAYGITGNKQAALLIYDELKTMAARRYVPAVCHAIAHSSLGETDKAFEMLDHAFQERAGLWFLMLSDPVFDNLRTDRRFTALIKKIGLEPRIARP